MASSWPKMETRHGRLMEVIDHLKCLKVQRIGIEVEQR
jgi:hypothetical protein